MAIGLALAFLIIIVFVAGKSLDDRLNVIEQKLDQLLEAQSSEYETDD